jgi:cell division protein FtsW
MPGMRTARRRARLLLAAARRGVTSLFAVQAILNVFAVLSIAPLTGVPLPLVSYGSSSLLVMLSAMGMLLNGAARQRGRARGGGAHALAKTATIRRWAASRGSRSQRAGQPGT